MTKGTKYVIKILGGKTKKKIGDFIQLWNIFSRKCFQFYIFYESKLFWKALGKTI